MRCEKRNAPANVAASARAMGNGLETLYPMNDYSTVSRKALSISDLLHTGAENGTTLRELVAATGLNERMVRLKIQRERKAGKLILSNSRDGYFLPARPEDVQYFARSMSRRAAEIASIARAAEAALEDITGQAQIAGWNDG